MRRLALGGAFPRETYRRPARMPLWPAIAITAGMYGAFEIVASVLRW